MIVQLFSQLVNESIPRFDERYMCVLHGRQSVALQVVCAREEKTALVRSHARQVTENTNITPEEAERHLAVSLPPAFRICCQS